MKMSSQSILRCVHRTPDMLVDELTAAVSSAVHGAEVGTAPMRILDAFAGDGRLGLSIERDLAARGVRTNLVLLDADRHSLPEDVAKNVEVVCADFFAWPSTQTYDVVVANPPYRAVGRSLAARAGLPWAEAGELGRNLYGIAVARLLRLTKPGGILGVLAPFGWIRGRMSSAFRQFLASHVSSVEILAHSRRNLFTGVSQDVAIQIFRRREAAASGTHLSADVRVLLDGSLTSIRLSSQDRDHERVRKTESAWRAHVGSVVWNRTSAALGSYARGARRLYYGANIGAQGTIAFPNPVLGDRQYLVRENGANERRYQGPALLLRRVMLGTPGAWRPVAAVLERSSRFYAENHVIVIRPPEGSDVSVLSERRDDLVAQLTDHYRIAGSPSISVSAAASIINSW